jgi:hypothetical protein
MSKPIKLLIRMTDKKDREQFYIEEYVIDEGEQNLQWGRDHVAWVNMHLRSFVNPHRLIMIRTRFPKNHIPYKDFH